MKIAGDETEGLPSDKPKNETQNGAPNDTVKSTLKTFKIEWDANGFHYELGNGANPMEVIGVMELAKALLMSGYTQAISDEQFNREHE